MACDLSALTDWLIDWVKFYIPLVHPAVPVIWDVWFRSMWVWCYNLFKLNIVHKSTMPIKSLYNDHIKQYENGLKQRVFAWSQMICKAGPACQSKLCHRIGKGRDFHCSSQILQYWYTWESGINAEEFSAWITTCFGGILFLRGNFNHRGFQWA